MDIQYLPEGKIIHSSADTYGNILVVDYPRYRVMSFDSIYEQSGYYLERPFASTHEYIRIMMLVLGFSEPRHITVLGLGGGSLLRSLHHYLSHCDFHIVELRQKVYDVAKKYFDIPVDQRVRVSIADAQQQLKLSEDSSTDIIFADMYDAYHMNPTQAQQPFIDDCARALTASGWLVINFHTLPDSSSTFYQSLTESFCTILLCSSKSVNHILFACKSPMIDNLNTPLKLKKMQSVLTDDFMPLYNRLENVLRGRNS